MNICVGNGQMVDVPFGTGKPPAAGDWASRSNHGREPKVLSVAYSRQTTVIMDATDYKSTIRWLFEMTPNVLQSPNSEFSLAEALDFSKLGHELRHRFDVARLLLVDDEASMDRRSHEAAKEAGWEVRLCGEKRTSQPSNAVVEYVLSEIRNETQCLHRSDYKELVLLSHRGAFGCSTVLDFLHAGGMFHIGGLLGAFEPMLYDFTEKHLIPIIDTAVCEFGIMLPNPLLLTRFTEP